MIVRGNPTPCGRGGIELKIISAFSFKQAGIKTLYHECHYSEDDS